ncbi:hypothetical protein FOZ62_014230 [Perkinsus olseni]|uniref:Glycogenin n=2 Tax=Perkinsus olseni TaxID=32597 RepID=A0A7J6SY18_PEROL|nr:hypothetical protein FOZ62_014230 [Perkinsus olseni]
MGDTSYIAGAMVMACSVRKHCAGGSVPFHTVCIVDKNMTDTEALDCVFDRVVRVEPILAEPMGKRWKRYGAHYDSWIDACLTKLHVFNLYKMGYQKVVLVDADVLVVDDHFASVLSAPAPSGICSDEPNKLDGKPSHLRPLKTGDKVPAASLRSALAISYGMRGCLMVLPTGARHFQQCLERVAKEKSEKEGYVGKCGDPKCNAGPDEWLLSVHFKGQWRHLEEAFCCRYWHAQTRGVTPIAIHFVTDKPWSRTSKEHWPDFDIWLKYAHACLRDIQKKDQASRSGCKILNAAIEVCEERRIRSVQKMRDSPVGTVGRYARMPRNKSDRVESRFGSKKHIEAPLVASAGLTRSTSTTGPAEGNSAKKKRNRRRRPSNRYANCKLDQDEATSV